MIIPKALSIQQPWPWAIFHGKDIENRKKNTTYRGLFFIHASRTFDDEGYDWLLENRYKLDLPELPARSDIIAFQKGGLVGISHLRTVVRGSASRWFFGPYGYLLQVSREISPIVECKGQLGFFDVPEDIAREALTRLR